MPPTYWQVAAGSQGREYHEDFLRFGMAFVGGKSNIEAMRKVKVGDRIILKSGQTKIIAVGLIVERDGIATGEGDKEWLKDFDGWNLLSYCNVEWHKPDKAINTSGLTRWTIQGVHQSHLIEEAERCLRDEPAIEKIEAEPRPTRKIADPKILDLLIKEGFSQGLSYAPKQVKGYAHHFHNCRVAVVSNGYCYKTYERDKVGEFKDNPTAYLNLLNPRERYPRDPNNVDGCLKVLKSLLPFYSSEMLKDQT